jgi:hypothetical protein
VKNQFEAMQMSDQARSLLREFVAAGWSIGKPAINYGVPWYAWRDVEIGALPDSRELSPKVVAEIHEVSLPERVMRTVEFDVRGLADDMSFQTRVSGVSFDDAVRNAPRITAVLVASWNAVNLSATSSEMLNHF